MQPSESWCAALLREREKELLQERIAFCTMRLITNPADQQDYWRGRIRTLRTQYEKEFGSTAAVQAPE